MKAGLCSISLHELGLFLVQSCTRGVDVRFNQLRPSPIKMSSFFLRQAVSKWNKLPGWKHQRGSQTRQEAKWTCSYVSTLDLNLVSMYYYFV